MPDKIQVVTRPRKEVETLIQHLQLDIDDDGVNRYGRGKAGSEQEARCLLHGERRGL
jgi:hypothetical protein